MVVAEVFKCKFANILHKINPQHWRQNSLCTQPTLGGGRLLLKFLSMSPVPIISVTSISMRHGQEEPKPPGPIEHFQIDFTYAMSL